MPILTDRIYEGLVKHEKSERLAYRKRTKGKPKSLTASIIWSVCRRARGYEARDLRPDQSHELDPATLSRFWDGKVEHQVLRYLFKDCGIQVIDEEISNTCQGVYVRIDYRIKIDGQIYNVEFKSMNPSSYSVFLSHGIVAFPGYYAQCQLMAGSSPRFPSLVLCKSKGESEYEDEIIKPDWDFIDELAKRKEDFDNVLTSGTLPERDFEYNSAQCEGCEYRFRCWFSRIRDEVLVERDLGKNEKKVVDSLYQGMQDNYDNFSKYLESEANLKNYIAFLHTKHAVSKVKLEGITSSLVRTNPVSYDMDYIFSLLAVEQIEKATKHKTNKFYRTIIK